MELNKCLGCMEDFQGYPCPKCGFAPEQTQKNAFALPPQTILVGKFLLGRVLGQDEIGITYIGWDIGLGQKVAIQEYFPGLGICAMREVDTGHLVWRGGESAERARGEVRELFLEEAKKTAKADGIPGIARIRGMFRANGTDYIVMDYVEGETLQDRIRKSGPLSWEQARRVFRPALQTMEAVHKAGLLHRNLNPGNLVLTPDGQVKILGLGLLDYRNINHTFSAPLMSSLGEFGAPERAQKSAGPWTDVYSMAATVYYALTGNTICLDLDETGYTLLKGSLALPDALPKSAREALEKALAPAYPSRTQSMEELEKGLFPEEAKPNPKPVPRKPWKMVWAAAAAAVVVLGGVLWGPVIKPACDYKKAQALLDAGQYEEAEIAFGALGNYRDSKEQVQEARQAGAYQQALALADAGQFDEAISAFESLGDYQDSADQARLLSVYQRADTLMEFGQYPGAAIVFSGLGDYRDSAQRADAARGMQQISLITAVDHTAALRSDGTVVTTGRDTAGQCNNTSSWSSIVAVAAGDYHTVGLRSNGTVVAVGGNANGQCKVSGWSDIVAVAAGLYDTVGLRSDGTAVAVGDNEDGQCDVSDWSNIVAVAAGGWHTVGLHGDGSVVAVGLNEDGQCDVSDWSDIVAIAAGGWHTVGLRADGTVVAVGVDQADRCDVSGWSDIVAIAAGSWHTVGLRSDGTVVAVGSNGEGQCDVSGWSDIVAIAAGWKHTVGLRSDGTVVAVGLKEDGQCDVSGWSNIRTPGTP